MKIFNQKFQVLKAMDIKDFKIDVKELEINNIHSLDALACSYINLEKVQKIWFESNVDFSSSKELSDKFK